MNDYQTKRQAAEELGKSLLPDADMMHIVSCSAPIPAGKNHEFLTLREEIVVKRIRRATAQAAGVRIAALEAKNAELLAALQGMLREFGGDTGSIIGAKGRCAALCAAREAAEKVTGSAA